MRISLKYDIVEGGGKKNKAMNPPLVSGVNPAKGVQYNDEAKNSAEVDKCIAYMITAIADKGNVNKDRTTYEMVWEVMRQDEVQDKSNDSDQSDTDEIEVIFYYRRLSNKNLKVKDTGLRICNGKIDAEDVKVNYLDTLALYNMWRIFCLTPFRNICYSREQEIWSDWSENFINAKMKCIARLVRIIGTNSLEEVFGSKVTFSRTVVAKVLVTLLCDTEET